MWQQRDSGRWGWEGEERYKGAVGERGVQEKGERKRKNESRIFINLIPGRISHTLYTIRTFSEDIC